MKSRTFLVLLLLLLVLALSVGVSIAQGPNLPGAGWYTGHTVANAGNGPATINVTAYDSGSSNTYSFNNNSQTIPQGGSVTWLPDDFSPALPASFSGSAIVSSDETIKGIVNVTNRPLGSLGSSGGEAAGQYRGVDKADITAAFPLVKYEFPAGHPARKSTTLFVQNAGSVATTVDVDFIGTGCSPCSYTTPSIGPGQMVAVNASNAGVAAGFIGAATATSNDPNVSIAAIFMETPVAENPVKQAQAANAFTPDGYDSTILVPVYKNDFGGRSTGLQVQNVGTVDVDLAVTYKGDSTLGAACAGQTITDNSITNVSPGASVTFLFGKELSAAASNLPAPCLASVTVEATVSGGGAGTPLIAGVINESFLPGSPPGGLQQSTTYAAFPASAATTKVSLPVVKDQFGFKSTGISCQNVGNAAATNVVYTYVIGAKQAAGTVGNAHITTPQTIQQGASQTILNPSGQNIWSTSALPTQTLNAVTVTSDQPIVCIGNESVFPFTGAPISQDKINYEGFNLTP